MPKPIAVGGDVTSAFLNDLVGVYDRTSAEVDVVNTTTETAICSKSIGAGHMSTNRILRATIFGDMLVNAAGGPAVTLRFKFGGTTWFGDSVGGIGQNATRLAWGLRVYIQNIGVANAQFAFGEAFSSVAVAGSVAGIGELAATTPLSGAFLATATPAHRVFSSSGNLAIDTASAQTFEVTAQWDTANALFSFRRKSAVLELL